MTETETFDAVVIGAGPNGLVAALMRAAQAAVAERLPENSPSSKALIDSIKMRFPGEDDEGEVI